jgi:hypothetical protein
MNSLELKMQLNNLESMTGIKNMNLRNFIYSLTCLALTVIIGAAIYEHTAIWPEAFSEPPKSLTMLQGEYGLNAQRFWIPVHPIALVLFAVTLVTHWKTARRKYVLVSLSGYVIVLVITFSFFVPALLSVTQAQFTQTVDRNMEDLVDLWVSLSLVRGGVLIVLAMVLFQGLTKPGTDIAKN